VDMGRTGIKPGGLLGKLIKGEAPADAPLDEVAEMLAYDGAGGVDEERMSQINDLLPEWIKSGDLKATKAGSKEVTHSTAGVHSFRLSPSFWGGSPISGHHAQKPPVGVPRPSSLTVDTLSIAAVDLAASKVTGWLKAKALWPDVADQWCGVSADVEAEQPSPQANKQATPALSLLPAPGSEEPKVGDIVKGQPALISYLLRELEPHGFTERQLKTWVEKPVRVPGLMEAKRGHGTYSRSAALASVRKMPAGDDTVAKQERRRPRSVA